MSSSNDKLGSDSKAPENTEDCPMSGQLVVIRNMTFYTLSHLSIGYFTLFV